MIDPTIARRRIAAAHKAGTRSTPNPQQEPVPDMVALLSGYIAQARLQAAAAGEKDS